MLDRKLILENIDRLLGAGEKVRARLPMIPGITDTDRNIDAVVSFLEKRDTIEMITLLPYNRLGEDKFERLGVEYPPGPLATQSSGEMKAIAGRFESAGLRVRIGG